MLFIILKHLQDFNAFGLADSKWNHKMLFYDFDFFPKIWSAMLFYTIWNPFTVYNFEVTSSHYWWGWLDKFWLGFCHLNDIPNISTQFDNNRPSTFGDYLSNTNWDGRQTDRQTDRQTKMGDLFLRTLGAWKVEKT